MQLRDAGGFHAFIAQQSGGSEKELPGYDTHGVVSAAQRKGRDGFDFPPKQLNE